MSDGVWFFLVVIVVPGGGSLVHFSLPEALPLRLRLSAGGLDGEVVGSPHDALCAHQQRSMWVVERELLRECHHMHTF